MFQMCRAASVHTPAMRTQDIEPRTAVCHRVQIASFDILYPVLRTARLWLEEFSWCIELYAPSERI